MEECYAWLARSSRPDVHKVAQLVYGISQHLTPEDFHQLLFLLLRMRQQERERSAASTPVEQSGSATAQPAPTASGDVAAELSAPSAGAAVTGDAAPCDSAAAGDVPGAPGEYAAAAAGGDESPPAHTASAAEAGVEPASPGDVAGERSPAGSADSSSPSTVTTEAGVATARPSTSGNYESDFHSYQSMSLSGTEPTASGVLSTSALTGSHRTETSTSSRRPRSSGGGALSPTYEDSVAATLVQGEGSSAEPPMGEGPLPVDVEQLTLLMGAQSLQGQ